LVTGATPVHGIHQLSSSCPFNDNENGNNGNGGNEVHNIRVIWNDLSDLTRMLDMRGLITDHKAGIPRASYDVGDTS
jgi:hypothetical protein